MRSALTLTLVLIAAMSGHSASACDASSQHPLRLLMSAGYSQGLEQGSAVDFTYAADLPSTFATELRVAAPVCTYIEPSTEPASRSYESAHVAGAPVHGP